MNDLEVADERLSHALARARAVDRADEELPTLVALAEVRRRQANPSGARQLLEDVWEPAELGPYPLLHADARDVLARIERDEGNKPAAVEAATAAYRLAWCDGPPFAYHWGLEAAKAHLGGIGRARARRLAPIRRVPVRADARGRDRPAGGSYIGESSGSDLLTNICAEHTC